MPKSSDSGINKLWAWWSTPDQNIFAPERFMVEQPESTRYSNSQMHTTKKERSVRNRGTRQTKANRVDNIHQMMGNTDPVDVITEGESGITRMERRSRCSHSACVRNTVIVLMNMFLTIAVSVFISPRISCSSLPSLMQKYCPVPTTALITPDLIPSNPVHSDCNLASSSEGAIPLPAISFVGARAFQQWWSTTFWSNAGTQYELALSDDNEQCWEFSGEAAQLAIRLGGCVSVDRFVLAHSSSTRSLASAPRHVMVWGMVEGEENIIQLNLRLGSKLTALFARIATVNPTMSIPIFHDHLFLPLAWFVYDAGGPEEQSFDVFREIDAFEVDFGVVVVQILDNWGASITSLCHIGVYGRQLA